MRTVFVICPLLLGAAVALVNCGGDDTSPTGGTTGGSGGTGGATGGTGGATGGGAGAGGASGGMDGGTTGGAGGTAGAAGSSGQGGASGAAGAAGSSGKGGASGAAGSAGKAGAAGAADAGGKAGAAGAGMTDGGPMCPATQPAPTDACNSQEDCRYGAVTCTCIDPGPDGRWGCSGGPLPEGGSGGDGGMCPATEPRFGDPCSDAGFLGPCIYDSGHAECRCDPDTGGWGCIRH
jgi:hypothetical protein